jgi:hypothetical protein
MFDPLQALAATSKSVDCLKIVHSLHVIFLLLEPVTVRIPKAMWSFTKTNLANQM